MNKLNNISNFLSKNLKVIACTLGISVLVTSALSSVTYISSDIEKHYYSKNDVARYIYQHNSLPSNFVTEKGRYNSPLNISDTKSMMTLGYNQGGDEYWNKEGILSDKYTYKEADIYSDRDYYYRGSERLVYTTNSKEIVIYYTSDHYESFDKITEFQLQPASTIFSILEKLTIFISIGYFIFIIIVKKEQVTKILNTLNILK